MVLIAAVLGVLVGIVVAAFALPEAYRRQVVRNGGPFQQGDMVRPLTGPHAGRVVRIYKLWDGAYAGHFRVELDEMSQKNATDLFHGVQVLREIERPENGLTR